MYLISYSTESGDRGHYLFRREPSKDFLYEFFKKNHQEEFTPYQLIGWEVQEIKFQKM